VIGDIRLGNAPRGVPARLTAAMDEPPRFGRLLTWSLGAAAANDFLQAGFTALTEKANQLD
jgi:hypothetical protein